MKKLTLLDRLDRRFGRYAIPNLTLLLIILQVAALVMSTAAPDLLDIIALKPWEVSQGEYYRLLTFLVMPLTNWLWAFFFYYLWYMMGTALESQWGPFRYNIYLMIGYLATIGLTLLPPFQVPGVVLMNKFAELSVFLAFAVLYPNFEIRVFFILPVKMKYLGLLTALSLLLMATGGTLTLLQVLASVLNFVIFFSPQLWNLLRARQRKWAWQTRVNQHRNMPRHTCTTCGVNSDSHPDMEFRYCTTCDGDHGYCADHIRNHQHVTADEQKPSEPTAR